VSGVVPATAAVYYVAADGNDAHAGTKDKPLATITAAGRKAQPGDSIKVKPGTLKQTVVLNACRGTAEQPIVFEADGGSVTLDAGQVLTNWRAEGTGRYSAELPGTEPVYALWAGGRMLLGPGYQPPFDALRVTKSNLVRGQCVVDNGRVYLRLFDSGDPNKLEVRVARGHCVLLQGCHYTIWRGIGAAWGLNGYKLEAGCSNNVISDAEIHHQRQGILEIGRTDTAAPCQFNTFLRLEFRDIGLTKFEHGVYTDGYRTRVLNCQFHHIAGAAIHAYPDTIQGEFNGNVMTDPLIYYAPEHFEGAAPPDPVNSYSAVIAWGTGGHRFFNNLIAGDFASGFSVRSTGTWFWNNTIVLGEGPAFFLEGNRADTRIANNAIQTRGFYVAGEAPPVLDYNAYSSGKGWTWGGTTYSSLAAIRKTGRETHGVAADPKFVDPKKGNYRLGAGSALRDVAWTFGAPAFDNVGTLRPQRGGIDIGAFEAP
jgi:hypothetical protein